MQSVKSAGLEALICVVHLRRRYLSAVSSDDQTTRICSEPAVTDHDALRVRVQSNVAVIRDMVANASDTQKKMWMAFVAWPKDLLKETGEFETQVVTRVLGFRPYAFHQRAGCRCSTSWRRSGRRQVVLTEGCKLRHVNRRLRQGGLSLSRPRFAVAAEQLGDLAKDVLGVVSTKWPIGHT